MGVLGVITENGGVRERPKRAVLKTVAPQGAQGSNPCPAATNKRIWPYSISVSTGDSQSSEPGSIPGRAARNNRIAVFRWSRGVTVSLPDFHSGCPSSILGGTTDENKKRSADERRGFCFLLSVARDVRLPPAPERHVVLARRGALLPQLCFRLSGVVQLVRAPL